MLTHCVPDTHAKGTPSLAELLKDQFPEITGVGDDPKMRPGIVHRLDKDTSGILVVARTQNAFITLKSLFASHRVEKQYRAIVCGSMREKQGTITFPIGRLIRNPMKRGISRKVGEIKRARHAVTHYRVLADVDQYSLVILMPETGRTHQLRVHLSALGHPIACDFLHGGKKVCCPPGAGRQLLHAEHLALSFPDGRRLVFESEAPSDFKSCEEKLFML
ncbi:MAG: pseudouridine synthase [Parcubacteria group bacterium Gr01-1014_66]|nr:MAG: pseudouridine synthase [Parcubacteria group bacterium Gr01-1014_66]